MLIDVGRLGGADIVSVAGDFGHVPAQLHPLLRRIGTVGDARRDEPGGLAAGGGRGRRAWCRDGAGHRRRAGLHPDLPQLVDHAVDCGLAVEVFSNLGHVTPALWETLTRPGVRLACSYYSDDPDQHAAITGRPSHARTRANIAEAVRRSIPLRVGVVDVLDGQHTEEARAELAGLGVTDVAWAGARHRRGVGVVLAGEVVLLFA